MHPGARLSAAPSPHLHCVASIGSRPGSAQPRPSLSLISLRLSGEFSPPRAGRTGRRLRGKSRVTADPSSAASPFKGHIPRLPPAWCRSLMLSNIYIYIYFFNILSSAYKCHLQVGESQARCPALPGTGASRVPAAVLHTRPRGSSRRPRRSPGKGPARAPVPFRRRRRGSLRTPHSVLMSLTGAAGPRCRHPHTVPRCLCGSVFSGGLSAPTRLPGVPTQAPGSRQEPHRGRVAVGQGLRRAGQAQGPPASVRMKGGIEDSLPVRPTMPALCGRRG